LDIVDILLSGQVQYAVVGALAASIHGAVRASIDADVLLSVSIQAAKGLENACQAAGFNAQMTRGDFDDPIPGLLKVTDSFGNQVDLLLGLKGSDSQIFLRTIVVPFRGTMLRFVGREDFIAMKVFAGGPVDLVDASRAIFADRESLDLDLTRRLAQRYGRDAAAALESLLSG
jgi:hypothetical protein